MDNCEPTNMIISPVPLSARPRHRVRNAVLRASCMVAVIVATTILGTSAQASGRVDRAARHAHNGRIVFQAFRGRILQIFTIKPDGSGLRQITHITHVPAGAVGVENPTWSPDGATIALDAPVGRGVNIFTTSPGKPLAPLPLSVGAFNGDPAYSPNGKQISFDQDIGPSHPKVHGIFIANADGSDAHRLTTAIRTTHSFDTESQWSPNGRRIAFTRVKNSHQAAVFIVNVNGTGLRRLTPWKLDAASPDWSPNGRTILFATYWDPQRGKLATIDSIRPDGSHRTVLTSTRAKQQSFRPSWAPDGSRVVFTRFTPAGKTGRLDLYTMNPNGTGLKRLTNMPKAFPNSADWGTAP
jgi:TolB protein